MFAILRQEVSRFLSSLIAYIVVCTFLLVTGLFLWIFPDYSILEFQFANLDPLFAMAPWIFLFLIPAITMRSFAEERKSGTIELLLTRPLSYYQIILGKLLAGVLLVILSLLPTLFYFYSVYRLADPVGNVDTGSIMGSYFGLLLLGSSYVSIGIMCSSFTDNQIVAFITSVFTCFFFYAAFDSLSLLSLPNNVLLILEQLGISAHYQSISKGVIDTRDLVYFFSIDTICVFATAFNLQKKYR